PGLKSKTLVTAGAPPRGGYDAVGRFLTETFRQTKLRSVEMDAHGGPRGLRLRGSNGIADGAMLLHRRPPGQRVLEIAGELFEIGRQAQIMDIADEAVQRTVADNTGDGDMEFAIERQRLPPVLQRN